MTVGDADTPWHHQFFHSVTFKYQGLTEDSSTAVRSKDGLWHGDVRIGIPPEHYFCSHHAYSSYILPLTLTCDRWEESGDSVVVAENHHIFYKCYSAAMWDGFEVAARSDCISAIKPKMVFRPTVFHAISFLVGADGWRTSTEAKFQQSRSSPSAHTGGILSVAAEMFIFHIFDSVQAFSVVVRPRLSALSGVSLLHSPGDVTNSLLDRKCESRGTQLDFKVTYLRRVLHFCF